MILAGGSGRNEVRLFDTDTGNLVCAIGDLEKSVLTMDYSKSRESFAFGSSDASLRIMDVTANTFSSDM